MRLVVKLFAEIMIKSRTLRRNLTSVMASNIRNLARDLETKVTVQVLWDQLDLNITPGPDEDLELFIHRLTRAPGIDRIEFIERHSFETLDELAPVVVEKHAEQIKDKTFRVTVKRKGQHTFKSFEAEQFLGGKLLQAQPDTSVDLHTPDEVVKISINNKQADLISKVLMGMGGFPMGTQGQVLSLLSGGFDSGVSSYLSMKRGFRTHFLFFNLGGINHEIGVKQVADYLWRQFSYSHRVKFITVPFEPVVAEILTKVHHTQMGVILKRLMIKAANQIIGKVKAKAIVTGESLAQVSSQTLPNLNLIDKVSDSLVIRPLIVSDKQDIIQIARDIGTEEFAISMPEYCAVISDRPTSDAKEERILKEEEAFDFAVLDAAIAEAKIEPIDKILESVPTPYDTEEVKMPAKSDVIIDIRHPHEVSDLPFSHNTILKIPFYQLQSKASELDESVRYLLYCDRGVMSHLQAAQLIALGHSNVMVFKPS